MKIKQVQIFNYGKWHQLNLTLHSNLNVIYGRNEAGKTTLMSFIKGVLFGYLQRRSSHKNYIPKGAANYGGQLEIEADHQDYIVKRKSGKHNGQLTIMDDQGHQLGNSVLKQILGPFDRNTFDSLYYFGTVDLRAVTKLKRKDLIYRIQRIGLAHSNDWINYQSSLVKQAKRLFSPTGYKPPLNQKLKRYVKLMNHVKDARAEYGSYQKLLVEERRIKSEQNILNKELKIIDSQLNRLHRDQTEWLQYRKLQVLRPVIDKSIRSGFTDTDEQHLKQMIQRVSQISNKLWFTKRRLITTKQDLVYDNRIPLYRRHQKRIRSLMNQSDKISALIQNVKLMRDRRTNLINQLRGAKLSKSVDHRIMSDEDYRTIKRRKLKVNHQFPLIDKLITKLQSRLKTRTGSQFNKSIAGLVIKILLIMLSTVINMWQLSITRTKLKQQYHVKDQLTELDQRIKRSIIVIKEYFKAWHFISQRNTLSSNGLNRLHQLRTLVGKLSKIVRTNQKAQSQIKDIKQVLNSNQRTRDGLNQKLQKFYQQRHVRDQDAFDQQKRRQQAVLQDQRTYHELSNQFDKSELTALKRYKSLDDVKDTVAKNTQQKTRLQTKNQTLTQELTEIQVKLHHLVYNGSYDELKQRAANSRTEIDNLSARWLKLELANQWIDATLNLATKGRVPKIEEQAQDNFKLLTNGRYDSILFNKTRIKVMRSDKRRFTLYELSKGTIQQLYLALIFAMAQVFGSDYPMPVLIDDGFTDFDVVRRKMAIKLLKSIGQKLQVIYCTSDENLVDQSVINLNQL